MATTPKCNGCKNPVAYHVTMTTPSGSSVSYACEQHRPGNTVHPLFNPIAAPSGVDYTSRFYVVRFLGVPAHV